MQAPIATSLTSKGQVTIPVEVHRALGLQPRDRVLVEFDPERGVGTFRRVSSGILSIYGAVEPRERPEQFEARHEEFEQGVADEVMRET